MKKYMMMASLALSTFYLSAQDFVPSYTEDIFRNTDPTAHLGGSARYRAMSGAMGALGGDLSATYTNPAGVGVFLGAEASVSLGLNGNSTESDFGGTSNTEDDTNFNLSQAGVVFVFEDLQSNDWKNIGISINYQKMRNSENTLDLRPTQTISDIYGNTMQRYYNRETTELHLTHVDFGANYKNKLYLGLGFNFRNYDSERSAFYTEHNNTDDLDINYVKAGFPYAKSSNGLSVSAGLIGRVNQNLRLGLAYESPTWYVDSELVATNVDALVQQTSSSGDTSYYLDYERNGYLYDITSAHRVTASAAWVIGKMGLLSADYTYKDYSPAKFKPESDFSPENNYIDNYMESSSALNIGGELRLNDFRLRAGYRYEQSPYKEVNLSNVSGSYQPYGDLTGFSAGIGYNFESFYIDASYDFYKRDRNLLISGNHYDYTNAVGGDDITSDEALATLTANMETLGLAQSVKDITEQQGSVNVTVGFRF